MLKINTQAHIPYSMKIAPYSENTNHSADSKQDKLSPLSEHSCAFRKYKQKKVKKKV